jgi:hypothetical protein
MDVLRNYNFLLSQPNSISRNSDKLLENGRIFVSNWEGSEIFGNEKEKDELRPILTFLGTESSISVPFEIELQHAKMLKILLRKPINQQNLEKKGMACILGYLGRLSDRSQPIVIEMCNALINSCFEAVNVQYLVELDGVCLLSRFFRTSDARLLSSLLGAFQAICFVPAGRHHIRQENVVSVTNFQNDNSGK